MGAYDVESMVGSLTIDLESEAAGLFENNSMWAASDHEFAIMLYAGYAAESKYDSSADAGNSCSDREAAHLLVSGIQGATEEALTLDAQRLICEHWEKVGAIAAALIERKTLTHEEWLGILLGADD